MVSDVCPEPCHVVSWTPPTPNCYKTKRSRLCVLWRDFGTVAAYPPSPVAMGGSRRPRIDQYFTTVRDGELQNAQCSLQAWAKDVTVLHSTLLQTMLFLGCLLVGCWDLKLFGCLWSFCYWGYKLNFLEGFRSQPRFFTVARNKPGALDLACACDSLHAPLFSHALPAEVREKREAHGRSRKRKRDVQSTEACPNGQKQSAIISWTYSDTEAEEPEILREDVTLIHENDQFLARVFPEKSTTAAKRIRRSASRPQKKYMQVSSVCAWDKSGFRMWFDY